MAQTASTFSAQKIVAGPANLPGGLGVTAAVFSFNGTNLTFDFVSPVRNVVKVDVSGAPMQVSTDGATLDRVVLNNTINASGIINLIAASTNGADIYQPTILRFSRAGSNNQDVSLTIFSKGG